MDASSESRRAKTDGRNTLWINPADAASRGIATGDVVRVYNDRGATLAGALVTGDVMSGVVRLPTGATFDPSPTGERLDVHGNPNAVTRDIGTSRLGQGCAAQSCLVEIERCPDPVPPVRAFEVPSTRTPSTTLRYFVSHSPRDKPNGSPGTI
jgi:biotin/methionine sulfoxide reductase